MTEMLSRGREFDPVLDYSQENYPPASEQAEFFRYVLLEGALDTKAPRMRQGPHMADFLTIMQKTDELIKKIDPRFTAEHIMPMTYQSSRARSEVMELEWKERSVLDEVARQKALAISYLVRAKLEKLIENQNIPGDILDVPGYATQAEDWEHYEATYGCTNACFRMVFGAIAGWTPSQAALSEAIKEQYGTTVVDDEVYHSIYQTDLFKEICDKEVRTVEILGADFSCISEAVTKMKQRRPELEVYCTVNLASETAGRSVWHTCVLLGARDGKVVYHDPSGSAGGAYTTTSYQKFVERWAVAYNKATLTLALPGDSATSTTNGIMRP